MATFQCEKCGRAFGNVPAFPAPTCPWCERDALRPECARLREELQAWKLAKGAARMGEEIARLTKERDAALASAKSAEEEVARLRKLLVETREVLDRTGARILQAATDDDMAHELLERAQQDVTAAERRIDSALKEPHA